MSSSLDRYTMSAQQLADKLGYHVNYVRYLASKGKLPALKRIRQWLFDPKEIEAFLLRGTQAAQDPAKCLK